MWYLWSFNRSYNIKQTLLDSIEKYKTKTNYKGKLIEFCRINNFPLPKYKTQKKDRFFISKITTIKMEKTCIGEGKTKKEAEHEVSKKTLIILDKIIMP